MQINIKWLWFARERGGAINLHIHDVIHSGLFVCSFNHFFLAEPSTSFFLLLRTELAVQKDTLKKAFFCFHSLFCAHFKFASSLFCSFQVSSKTDIKNAV